MESPPEGPARKAPSLKILQLADCARHGASDSRFQLRLQGLPEGSGEAPQPLWGAAPLYPRAGPLGGLLRRRDSSEPPPAPIREEQVRHRAAHQGVLRPPDGEIPDDLCEAPSALLRMDWRGIHRSGSTGGSLGGVPQAAGRGRGQPAHTRPLGAAHRGGHPVLLPGTPWRDSEQSLRAAVHRAGRNHKNALAARGTLARPRCRTLSALSRRNPDILRYAADSQRIPSTRPPARLCPKFTISGRIGGNRGSTPFCSLENTKRGRW